MRKFVVSFCDVNNIYNVICGHRLLSQKEYLLLAEILIYATLTKEKRQKECILFVEKENVEFVPEANVSPDMINLDLLLKALYYMDATLAVDYHGNVPFLLNGAFKNQVVFVLTCLLQNKPFFLKQNLNTLGFLEKVYLSIALQLNMNGKDLLNEGYLLDYLQRLYQKRRLLANKMYSVLRPNKITEVSFYTKYDNFHKEFCYNFRFLVTKSTSAKCPVGSFVFGVVQPNRSSVILYKDADCLFPMENED